MHKKNILRKKREKTRAGGDCFKKLVLRASTKVGEMTENLRKEAKVLTVTTKPSTKTT